MSRRETLLRSLLRYDRPHDEVLAELEGYDEETEQVEEETGEDPVEVEFTLDDAVQVLNRFLEEEVTTDALEEWAEVVREHEEIVLDPGAEDSLGSLLDEVGELTPETAESWIARLEGES